MRKFLFFGLITLGISSYGQLKVYNSGNVGVGSTNPLSKFSVNTDGASHVTGYFYNPLPQTTEYQYSIIGYTNTPSGISMSPTGVYGCVQMSNNSNKSKGIMGYAYSSTPRGNGRTFGVYGIGGNAAAGYNFGVFGKLLGSTYQYGAAIYGTTISTDDGKANDNSSLFTNFYSGYFYGGPVRMECLLGVKKDPDASYAIDVNGDIRANGWTSNSDYRLKTNIQNIDDSSLSSLFKINAIKYNLNLPKDSIIAELSDTGKSHPVPEDIMKDERVHIGFIAQDVEKEFPNLVRTDKKGYKSIYYMEFIPIIIEALKKQTLKVDSLERVLNSCCASAPILKSATDAKVYSSDMPVLYQNNPNPFSENTTISYYLPETTQHAMIYIYDMTGTQLRNYILSGRGNGSILLNGSELKSGMFLYSLIADGKEIDTKRMILTQ